MTESVYLSELVDIYLGLTHTPEYVLDGVPFLSVKNISSGTIDFSQCNYITEEEYNSLPNGAKPQCGDMLFCRVGTIGKPVIIEENTPRFGSFVSLGFFRVKDNNLCKLKYLYYWMYSESFYSQVRRNVKGASQVNLNTGWLKNFRLPLYSLATQAEIVQKLEEVDRLMTLRKEQLSKMDELVKSRFIELFGDYDLSHPQESWVAIKEIGTVVGGATPKTDRDEYWGGSFRWITPAELEADSGYIYDSVRKLTKAGVESCSLQEMPVGTVILSSRAPIGKVAIAGNTFYCNQGFKNIICKEGITPRYLYTVLLLNVEYLNSLGRGATFKEISKGIVENIRIPVPATDLQEQFAAFVEQTDKSKLAIQESLAELETLKKALMQKYFG